MADISTTYVSGTQLNIGAFGSANISGTFVSESFLKINGQILTITIPATFVSESFLNLYANVPEILPLTAILPSTSTRYWLS